MQKLKTYINAILGYEIQPEPIPKSRLGQLPLFITETYKFYDLILFNKDLILIELRNEENFSVLQIEKHFSQIKQTLEKKVVLIADSITAFNRKRLIEKGINFIIPGKQLFLPDLLLDLRETFVNPKIKVKKQKLLPSAQYILLYHILHRYEKIEEWSLKQLAEKLKYTQTAITKAVDSLKYHELCEVTGSKEKFVHFDHPINELWHIAEPLLVNPVLKRVYVDEIPKPFMLNSNISALQEYSDINRSRQEYYAIEKHLFYELQKSGQFKNLNDYEGRYCLEVWKYNPDILATDITEESSVDPLSLYLSLRDSRDERIEMALEKIIEQYTW